MEKLCRQQAEERGRWKGPCVQTGCGLNVRDTALPLTSAQEAARVPRTRRPWPGCGQRRAGGVIPRPVGPDPGRWVGCRKELDFVPRETGPLEGQAGATGLSHIL